MDSHNGTCTATVEPDYLVVVSAGMNESTLMYGRDTT